VAAAAGARRRSLVDVVTGAERRRAIVALEVELAELRRRRSLAGLEPEVERRERELERLRFLERVQNERQPRKDRGDG